MTSFNIVEWQDLESPWSAIWAPSGRIRTRQTPGGEVFDGSIVVEAVGAKFFYFVVTEGHSPDRVDVRRAESPEAFGRFVPPILRVANFPARLPLELMLGPMPKRILVEAEMVKVSSAAGVLRVILDVTLPEALALDFIPQGEHLE